ncbi:hypothetical protein SRM_01039 [Salinibacter ruber M8]|uniref:Uncharacterized protein n=1 Tax=Salinibacter ruber (strain M8) TaxID=761659 RepID=D5H7F5_SALRM|nr:hypothetical protein SRM_01039 [Salinibacter ruber M8]
MSLPNPALVAPEAGFSIPTGTLESTEIPFPNCIRLLCLFPSSSYPTADFAGDGTVSGPCVLSCPGRRAAVIQPHATRILRCGLRLRRGGTDGLNSFSFCLRSAKSICGFETSVDWTHDRPRR